MFIVTKGIVNKLLYGFRNPHIGVLKIWRGLKNSSIIEFSSAQNDSNIIDFSKFDSRILLRYKPQYNTLTPNIYPAVVHARRGTVL